ncbi:MAG: extracellular solute-binding protein [Candidatus Delongbacteria bacterium]
MRFANNIDISQLKVFVLSIVLLISSMSLCSCNSAEKDTDNYGFPPIELENADVSLLSHWSKDSYSKTADEMYETYGLKVRMLHEEFNLIGRKALLMNSSGEPLDIVLYTSDQFPLAFAQDVYLPLDSYIDFNDELWAPSKRDCDSLRYKGKIYVAVNKAINRFIFFNSKLFKEKDIRTPYEKYLTDEWTWEALKNDAQQIIKRNSDTGEVDVYGIIGSELPGSIQASKNAAFVILTPEGLRNAVNDENMAEAMEYMYELFSAQDFVYDSSEDNEELFLSGKCAMMFDGIWRINSRYSEMLRAGDLGMVPIPRWQDSEVDYMNPDYGGFMISRNTENLSGALAFLTFYQVLYRNRTEINENIMRLQDIGVAKEYLDIAREINSSKYTSPVQPALIFDNIYDNWTPYIWLLHQRQKWSFIRSRTSRYIQDQIDEFNRKYDD